MRPERSEAPQPWWVVLCRWAWKVAGFLGGTAFVALALNLLSTWLTSPHGQIPADSPLMSGLVPRWLLLLLLGCILALVAVTTWLLSRSAPSPTASPTLAQQNRDAMFLRVGQTYRNALQNDLRITRFQILEMTRPLEVSHIYVPVQVHVATRPSYEGGNRPRPAEAQHDPNEVFRERQHQQEVYARAGLYPDEAIRIWKRSVILGDVGAGKTTLIKYLALKSVHGQLPGLPDLPIVVELNAFATSGSEDILTFAATTWKERYGLTEADARAYMERHLEEGKALLFLDALDETFLGDTPAAAEETYLHVRQAILQIATRYPEAPMVVTARKAGYHQQAPLVGFTVLEVLGFRPGDIETFVERWFASYDDPQQVSKAAHLNPRLAGDPRLHALAANPLLLTLIVLVYEDRLDLPEGRAELYKRCVDILLSKWDATRNIRRRRLFKPEHKYQLLTEIAWHFHGQGQYFFAEKELLAVIARFLPAVNLPGEQNNEILAEISVETGLLKQQARGWYSFEPLTFQEYFASLYAVEQQQLERLLAHRNDPWWEEVLLLYAGLTDASLLLQRLLGSGGKDPLPEDVFQTNLVLAGRCLAARPTVRRVALRQEAFSRLFEILTTTRYTLTRRSIAEVLVEIGEVEATRHLTGLLADEELYPFIRESIAQVLGESGDHSLVPELLRLLMNERIRPYVRKSIALALGSLGAQAAVPRLLELLNNEQMDQALREQCALALSNYENPSVTEGLLTFLANEQANLNVRQRVASALGTPREPSVTPRLLELLANEQVNLFVRGSVAQALGTLGQQTIVPELLALLTNERLRPYLRGNIAYALGVLGDRSAAPPLLALLAHEQEELTLRMNAAYALGVLGERSMAQELLRLLANETTNLSLRESLAYALGWLNEPAVLPELRQLFARQASSAPVRRHLAYALGALGDRSVTQELVHQLVTGSFAFNIDPSLGVILGKLGNHAVVPALIEVLASKQFDIVQAQEAALALEQLIDDEKAARSLASSLQQVGSEQQADIIHRVLWGVSRRAKVAVFLDMQEVQIVKW